MTDSWTKMYLFGDASPLLGASPGGGQEMSEHELSGHELEALVVTVGGGAASGGEGSVSGATVESRGAGQVLDVAPGVGTCEEGTGTEVSTIPPGIDAVGGRDCGVQTDLCLMDASTRLVLRLLLEGAQGDEESARSSFSSARKARSAPQDPRKFRSEAGQDRQRARQKAKKARKRQQVKLAEAEQCALP